MFQTNVLKNARVVEMYYFNQLFYNVNKLNLQVDHKVYQRQTVSTQNKKNLHKLFFSPNITLLGGET